MRRSHLLCIFIALVAVGIPATIAADPVAPQVNERTGITLKLIDVNVLDEDGQPIPGLVESDFEISLNSRLQELYAVEDLCLPEDAESRVTIPTYLYIDFRLILAGGLRTAEEVLPELIAGLPADTGPIELIFNEEQSGLRRVPVANAYEATEVLRLALTVPHGPDLVLRQAAQRSERCIRQDVSSECFEYAEEHLRSSRHSLIALARFLTSIAAVQGRKRVFYVHQIASLRPHELYLDPSQYESTRYGAEGLTPWARELGGTAVDRQTTIYPIVLSDGDLLGRGVGLARQAINFGAVLADTTGGAHNRIGADLGGVLEAANRDASCIYRLAVELPARKRSKLFNVAVAVQGELLPHRYAMEYLTAPDAWMRSVQAVLMNPDTAEQKLFASVVPLQRDKKRWDVRLLVELDLSDLFPVPRGAQHTRAWEIGALLHNTDNGRSWEFLDQGEVATDELENPARIQFVEEIDRLPAGNYELRAFARDRFGDRFAAGLHTIELPGPGAAAALEPLFWTTPVDVFTTPLPPKGSAKEVTVHHLKPLDQPIPSSPGLLGEQVQISRLYCEMEPHRFALLDENGAVVPVGSMKMGPRGDCRQLTVDYALPPGAYRYQPEPDAKRTIEVVVAATSSP